MDLDPDRYYNLLKITSKEVEALQLEQVFWDLNLYFFP